MLTTAEHAGFAAGAPATGTEPTTRVRRGDWVTRVVALAALILTLAYLSWRALFTLNLDAWWLALPLLILECHAALGLALFTFSLWDVDALPPAPAVADAPGPVAVLIPTYDEAEEVLLPTIAAAVALRPAHDTWVLDDGCRPWVAALANELGARYLTRPEHRHAKAGNLNHALESIDAEFIAVLDADHVATPVLLTQTLGYFADPRVALVQTPQDFYNLDSFEHEHKRGQAASADADRYHEQALFYRTIQPGKNRWGGAFWCGTNAVLRVEALRDVGGIATDTITEDIHTTIRLHQRGWRTVYHNEVLARGLAAGSADQYQQQRYRWGVGAMQVLRTDNPLTISGLTLGQRLTYAKTLGGWFDAWRTLGYLLLPPLVLLTGAMPIRADAWTFALWFVATFLLQRLALRRLSRGHHRETLATVFEFVRMTPNLLATCTLLRQRPAQFRVTPKGRTGAERRRTHVPTLLSTLLGLSVFAASWCVLSLWGYTPTQYEEPWAAGAAMLWLVVNAGLLVAAIRRVRAEAFGAERRASVRFPVDIVARIDAIPCYLTDVSLTGARAVVSEATTALPGGLLTFWLSGARFQLPVAIRSRIDQPDGASALGLAFDGVPIAQRARLALALFGGLTHDVAFDAVEEAVA